MWQTKSHYILYLKGKTLTNKRGKKIATPNKKMAKAQT